MIFKSVLLSAYVAFTASAAGAATLNATNQTDLNNAIKVAQGGDTIVARGTFGLTYIKSKSWASVVTLDATDATFTDALAITNTNNLTIMGGRYGSTTTAVSYNRAIYISVGNNINILNPVVVGAFTGGGIGITGVTNTSVTGGTFFGLKVGVVFGSVTNGTILHNMATGMVSDGFNVVDSSNVRISFNTCRDGTPLVGMHPDCVQLWSTSTTAPQSNIQITDNYAQGLTQGFTSFDQDTNSLVNGLIARNRLDIYYSQGIACFGCFNTVISDNVINTLPGAPHVANINVLNGDSSNTVTNNIKTGFDKSLAHTLPLYTVDQLMGVAPPPQVQSVTYVPEPGTWSLFVAGFGLIGTMRRRAAARNQTGMTMLS